MKDRAMRIKHNADHSRQTQKPIAIFVAPVIHNKN